MKAAQQAEDYFVKANKSKLLISWELARKRAFYLRSKAIEQLDRHLLDFEAQFTKNQGKMIWAPQSSLAGKELRNALQGKKVYTYAHRHLNELGLSNENNWHYLSENDFQIPSMEESVALVFPQFYVSENGAFLLAHSHPVLDKLLATCQKIYYIVGIEQVLPTLTEAEGFLTLLSIGNQGGMVFSSVHISSGNRQAREGHCPQESFALLMDNGRGNLLAEIPQRQALYCIGCNACNRYSNLPKGQAGTSSVIEMIKAPYTEGAHRFQDCFGFPLSGRVTEACPVGIDLKSLILENRKVAVDRKQDGRGDSLAWKAWTAGMMSRKWINKTGSMKNFTLRSFFRKYWGEKRDFPKVAEQSFNEWWVANRGK